MQAWKLFMSFLESTERKKKTIQQINLCHNMYFKTHCFSFFIENAYLFVCHSKVATENGPVINNIPLLLTLAGVRTVCARGAN